MQLCVKRFLDGEAADVDGCQELDQRLDLARGACRRPGIGEPLLRLDRRFRRGAAECRGVVGILVVPVIDGERRRRRGVEDIQPGDADRLRLGGERLDDIALDPLDGEVELPDAGVDLVFGERRIVGPQAADHGGPRLRVGCFPVPRRSQATIDDRLLQNRIEIAHMCRARPVPKVAAPPRGYSRICGPFKIDGSGFRTTFASLPE